MANQRSCIRQLLTQHEYRRTVTNELTKHCLLLGSGRQTIAPIYFQHGPVPAAPSRHARQFVSLPRQSCHTVFFQLTHLHRRESTDVSETHSPSISSILSTSTLKVNNQRNQFKKFYLHHFNFPNRKHDTKRKCLRYQEVITMLQIYTIIFNCKLATSSHKWSLLMFHYFFL